MTEYTLIRSNRKSIAIHVSAAGVQVRAPLKASKRDIDAFVNRKERWIEEKLEELRARENLRGSHVLNYGAPASYRGKEYPISAREGNHVGFDMEAFYMPPDLSPGEIARACEQIYRLLARRHLPERTRAFALQMNVNPSGVKISGAKTRWGSCSAKESINFSWRLAMADDEVIDYVVVHELAHLLEMNHSERFWAIVEATLPDYRTRRERLRELQKRLSLENWY